MSFSQRNTASAVGGYDNCSLVQCHFGISDRRWEYKHIEPGKDEHTYAFISYAILFNGQLIRCGEMCFFSVHLVVSDADIATQSNHEYYTYIGSIGFVTGLSIVNWQLLVVCVSCDSHVGCLHRFRR